MPSLPTQGHPAGGRLAPGEAGWYTQKGHYAGEICSVTGVSEALRGVCCRDKAGGRILLSYLSGNARKSRSTYLTEAGGQRREGGNGLLSRKNSGIKAARDDDGAKGTAVGQEGDR
jgi:hypothetical protein